VLNFFKSLFFSIISIAIYRLLTNNTDDVYFICLQNGVAAFVGIMIVDSFNKTLIVKR